MASFTDLYCQMSSITQPNSTSQEDDEEVRSVMYGLLGAALIVFIIVVYFRKALYACWYRNPPDENKGHITETNRDTESNNISNHEQNAAENKDSKAISFSASQNGNQDEEGGETSAIAAKNNNPTKELNKSKFVDPGTAQPKQEEQVRTEKETSVPCELEPKKEEGKTETEKADPHADEPKPEEKVKTETEKSDQDKAEPKEEEEVKTEPEKSDQDKAEPNQEGKFKTEKPDPGKAEPKEEEEVKTETEKLDLNAVQLKQEEEVKSQTEKVASEAAQLKQEKDDKTEIEKSDEDADEPKQEKEKTETQKPHPDATELKQEEKYIAETQKSQSKTPQAEDKEQCKIGTYQTAPLNDPTIPPDEQSTDQSDDEGHGTSEAVSQHAAQNEETEKQEVKLEDASNISDIDSAGDNDEAPELKAPQAQVQMAHIASLPEKLVSKAKLSHSERKVRRALSKQNLKEVTGVCQVTMRTSRNKLVFINHPDVYRRPGSKTYIVFGKAKTENLSQEASIVATEKFKDQEPITPTIAEEEEEEVEEIGIEAKDIELVMSQASVSRAKAVKALKNNPNDAVRAILELVM